MKCNSCTLDIDPKWKHAININTCPWCGSAIFDEHLKNLLSVLTTTMEKLQEYPEQLDDWMLSNHSYIKTSSTDLIKHIPKEMMKEPAKQEDNDFQKRKAEQDKKFIVKVKTDSGEEEVVAEKIQSANKPTDFAKRAEAVKPNIEGYKTVAEKTEHLKRIADQIKKGVTLTTDNNESLVVDEEETIEYEASSANKVVSSALPNSDEDEIPAVVLNMTKGNSKNALDLLKLQQMQERTRRSREAFESGENRSKPGGFSRS